MTSNKLTINLKIDTKKENYTRQSYSIHWVMD